MLPMLVALAGCKPTLTSYQIAPADRPVPEHSTLGEKVHSKSCQRVGFLAWSWWHLDPPYSLADELERLGRGGPLMRVVVEETIRAKFWCWERCLYVTAWRVVPPPVAAATAPAPAAPPGAAAPSAPVPAEGAAAAPPPTAPAPAGPVVHMPPPDPAPRPAPPPPSPPPAPKVAFTLASKIGEDGDDGVKALRAALEKARDPLLACFSAPGKVSLEVMLTKSGEVRSAEPKADDAGAGACVAKVVSGLRTDKIRWLTKMTVDVKREQ